LAADFFKAGFLDGAFFDGDLATRLVAAVLAAGRLAAGFLVAGFFAGAFFAVAFPAGAFTFVGREVRLAADERLAVVAFAAVVGRDFDVARRGAFLLVFLVLLAAMMLASGPRLFSGNMRAF
jgi:hypothetical protein